VVHAAERVIKTGTDLSLIRAGDGGAIRSQNGRTLAIDGINTGNCIRG
jgi:hypothetical protein